MKQYTHILPAEEQDQAARQVIIKASEGHRTFGKLLKRVYHTATTRALTRFREPPGTNTDGCFWSIAGASSGREPSEPTGVVGDGTRERADGYLSLQETPSLLARRGRLGYPAFLQRI